MQPNQINEAKNPNLSNSGQNLANAGVAGAVVSDAAKVAARGFIGRVIVHHEPEVVKTKAWDLPREDMLKTGVDVVGLIEATLALGSVLVKETELLRNWQIKEIAPLVDEKRRLTEYLEHARKMLARHPGAIASFNAEEREELVAIDRIFKDILAEYEAALTRARRVNQVVVDMIARAAIAQSYDGLTYGMEGTSAATQPVNPISICEMA